MKKYKVYYRQARNYDWEDNIYDKPFVEAENAEAAIRVVQKFVSQFGYEPDLYDWTAKEV